ncbi:MAG TPA: histidine kinase [Dehalococcoidia bacterium]|nr:histidine kinase [Dehalococcoidia bacterium]
MPIRLRFLLVANLFLAGLGITGYIAIRDVQHASDVFSNVARDSIDQVRLSDQIRANLPDLRALELEYVMTTDPHQQPAVLERMQVRREALRQVMGHYEFSQNIDTGTDCVSCHQVYGRYSQSVTRVLDLVGQGRHDEALAEYQDSADDYAAVLTEAEDFRQSNYASAREYSLQGSESADEARNILIGAIAVAVVLTIALGHTFSSYVHRRLKSLTEGTQRVITGDLGGSIPVQGTDEFGQLAHAFNSMTDSLRTSQEENANLHDVAIRMREERIKLLSDGLKRAVEAQENERQRVSQELHDGIGQALTALQLGLGRIEVNAKSPEIQEAAASLRDLSVNTLIEIRELARDLRPGMLDEMGLLPTLRNYVKAFSERTGIPVELSVGALAGRLPPELEVTIFRIVQEGLANMARHARADHAWVALELTDGTLSATVRDDGVGFDVAAIRGEQGHSLGLSGMEERCRFSNGNLSIESAPGAGTKMVCTWQLSPEVLAAWDSGELAAEGAINEMSASFSQGGQP